VDVTALAKINREYGYDAGDRVLASLSALIRQILRATDVASRWGSDEFGILLYDAEAEGAHQVAERLAAQVVRQKFTDPASGREFAVEVAQGIAAYPAHTTDKTGNELVDCAYGALKSAKRQEREGKKIGVWSGA
jgi:diguanylate cyclase (GGDEF)-like protein